MADIGVPELVIILVIVIICFGPSRIGGLGKSLGEGIRSFRESVRDETLATSIPVEPLAATVADSPVTTLVSVEPIAAITPSDVSDGHVVSAA